MNNKIGEFICKLRKEKGLTQSELGKKLFVTDKAVSKWERGLSLPDISILENLSNELGISISELLSGKKGVNRKYSEEDINKIIKELKSKQLTRLIIMIIIFIIILVIVSLFIFKNIYLGVEKEKVEFINSNGLQDIIELEIPKYSFSEKVKENSYSFKNFRSKKILEAELKEYLKKFKYISCNNSTYYYNEKENFTIVSYGVTNNLFYNTISIQLYNDNYCTMESIKSIKSKVFTEGFLANNFDYLHGEEDYFLIWMIINDSNVENFKFFTHLTVNNTKKGKTTILESSEGYVEIINNKLIYTRTKIYTNHSSINIPNTTTFTILDNKKLELNDHYLDKYEKNLILRPETEEERNIMIEQSKKRIN